MTISQKMAQLWRPANSLSQARNDALERADLWKRNQDELLATVSNAAGDNTIDPNPQRASVLQTVIVDFARRVLPLRAFAAVFSDVPLEGTDTVEVPFYDLDSGASTTWNPATGYVANETVTSSREIEVDTRIYQALRFTSQEIARQPFLKIAELARLKAEKLASDVVTDVLSAVTQANFGDPVLNKPAAAFDSDDVADLKLACKLWPEGQRSLVIDSSYDCNLLKDPSVKSALNFGSNEPIRSGRVPNIMGFDFYEVPTIPANAENLVGFVVQQSAILFAQAPIAPIQEVRNAGTDYRLVVDPLTGIALSYRAFGEAQYDRATHVIEATYGYEKGNSNALKRITSE